MARCSPRNSATLPLWLFALIFSPQIALAHELTPQDLSKIGFDQRLDQSIPLKLAFRDETGRTVRLKDYFSDRPVILVPVYYHCPNLCPLLLRGLADSLKALSFDAGKDFGVVVISIDPREGPDLAMAAKRTTLAEYDRPATDNGWHFLTGEDRSIQPLAQAIGFRYVYDAAHDQYAHASGIVIATAAGVISRYFYGVTFNARDLRLGLVDASADEIGSPIDQLLLRCFHYDPKTGKYTFAVLAAVRIAGAITVLVLGGLVGAMILRERRRKRHQPRRA